MGHNNYYDSIVLQLFFVAYCELECNLMYLKLIDIKMKLFQLKVKTVN